MEKSGNLSLGRWGVGWKWGHPWVRKSARCVAVWLLLIPQLCGEAQPYRTLAHILTGEPLPSLGPPSTELFSLSPMVRHLSLLGHFFFTNLEFQNLPVNDPGKPR